MTGPLLTLSNVLSVCRLLLAVPIVLLLLRNDPSGRWTAAALIVAAGMTDLADGWAARRLRQVSELGKILDPLADKIAAAAVAAALAALGRLPLWFLGAVVARDLLILAGGFVVRTRRGLTLQSNPAGKWAAALLAATILAAVLDAGSPPRTTTLFVLATTTMLALSFALYCRRFAAVMGGRGADGAL